MHYLVDACNHFNASVPKRVSLLVMRILQVR